MKKIAIATLVLIFVIFTTTVFLQIRQERKVKDCLKKVSDTGGLSADTLVGVCTAIYK